MNAPFNKDQINAALEGMKAEIMKNIGNVQTMPIDEALTAMGQMAALADTFGFKLVQDFFGEVTMNHIVSGMRVHGHVIFEMHFPCGTKFEVVVRHREGAGVVHTYAYKL